MANKKNPTSSTILQVLLDLKANGYENMTVDEMINYLQQEKGVLESLDKQWSNRLYSDSSMKWASITILPALMNLSPEALKVLVLMGIYADQTSLIRVTKNVITQVTGIKTTALKSALRELEDCGAIRVEVKHVRHTAPIYRVNGNIIAVGRRNKVFNFDGPKDKYLLRQDLQTKGLKLVANRHTDKQADGSKIMYHELVLEPINEERPLDAEETSKGLQKDKSNSKKHTSKTKPVGQDDDCNIPGQMDFSDLGIL